MDEQTTLSELSETASKRALNGRGAKHSATGEESAFARRDFDEMDAMVEAHLLELEAAVAAGQLPDHLKGLVVRLRDELGTLSRQGKHIAAERARIASHKAELDMARDQVVQQRRRLSSEYRQKRKKLRILAKKLDARLTKLHAAEQTLAEAREAQEDEAMALARRRSLVNERQAQLERGEMQLESRRHHTSAQRQRIAGRLRLERNDLLHQRRQSHTNKGRARTSEEGAQATLHSDEVARLRDENELLTARLADLEHRLAQVASTPANTDAEHIEDLQRRFEMAVDDVRELKRRNAELEESLAKRPTASDEPVLSASLSWEATKKRLLSQLESESGELSADDRLTVEGAIRITDDVVRQRDQEIAVLKEQLAKQSGQLSEASAAAASMEGVFSQDDVILHERERLVELEHEWADKVRQAEVELSVERANMARERAALKEKIRALESQDEKPAEKEPPTKASKAKKHERRWLDRLGLKEQ